MGEHVLPDKTGFQHRVQNC